MADEKESDNLGKSGSFSLNKIRKNPWMAATAVLALVLIFALFVGGGVGGIGSGAAADKVVSFVKSQGSDVNVVSTEKSNGLYKVTVNFQGQDVPVYVTLDGKYLAPSLIPIDGSTNNPTTGQATASQPADIPKSAKPVVELFVMSSCPYGLQEEKGIIPVLNLLKDKIDFKLRFVYYAMHGQTEVNENTRQYCIQKEQTSKLVSYLDCYAKSGDTDSCLASNSIDKTKLASCVAAADKQFSITANYNDQSSWLSGQFPKYDVDAALNTKYNVAGSPTLIINGVEASSGRDPNSLLKTICGAFSTAPSECSQTLSTATPNPGFTSGSTASGSASANCISP